MARLQASERQQQILETALRCFAAGGYHATTTARLAEAAGVTEPILYRHFDGKLGLFLAAVDEAGARLRVEWQGDPLVPPRRSTALRVMRAALAESARHPRIRAACTRQLAQLRAALALELDLTLAERTRRQVPPEDVAELVVAARLGPGSSRADRALAALLA